MENCNLSIEVYKKEKTMNDIEDLIKKKKKNLLKKTIEINEKKKMNEYLNDVESDYKQYLQHFKNQKQKQIDSLNLINNYLKMLNENEKIVDHQNLLLQKDQNEILEEIEVIREQISDFSNL